MSARKDDEMLRMCAADVVTDAGFTPVEPANADEAMLGSMDGLGLARTIKIILVSGRAELFERERPVNSCFFQKPFAMKQMIEGLQEMISAR